MSSFGFFGIYLLVSIIFAPLIGYYLYRQGASKEDVRLSRKNGRVY